MCTKCPICEVEEDTAKHVLQFQVEITWCEINLKDQIWNNWQVRVVIVEQKLQSYEQKDQQRKKGHKSGRIDADWRNYRQTERVNSIRKHKVEKKSGIKKY